MIDPDRATDDGILAILPGDDDAQVAPKHAKAGKKQDKKEERKQQAAGKEAEHDQKILWDADKIQLKWVRLTLLMVGIGFGADQTLHALGQGGVPATEIWVLRIVAQLLGVIGLVALVIATVQHGRLLLALSRAEPILPVARFPLSLLVAVIIVLLGLVALMVAVSSLGTFGRASVSAPAAVAAVGTGAIAAATATTAPPALAPAVRSEAPTASPVARQAAAQPVSVTATAEPAPAQAPTPAPTPGPAVAIPPPNAVVVQGTGSAGARLRQAPVDGETIAVLADGTHLTALDETSSAGDQRWQRVRTADDREGWIASDFLVADTP